MTGTDTANKLYKWLSAPLGAVSVFAMPISETDFELRVWIKGSVNLREIPKTFEGHTVVIEKMPRISPGH